MSEPASGMFYLASGGEYEVRCREDPEAIRAMCRAILAMYPDAGPPHLLDPESLFHGGSP